MIRPCWRGRTPNEGDTADCFGKYPGWADGIYRLRLAGDTSAITAPGQFVNLKLSGFFLRRPISVCDWENGEVTLIYKVLGHGTEAMTAWLPARRWMC